MVQNHKPTGRNGIKGKRPAAKNQSSGSIAKGGPQKGASNRPRFEDLVKNKKQHSAKETKSKTGRKKAFNGGGIANRKTGEGQKPVGERSKKGVFGRHGKNNDGDNDTANDNQDQDFETVPVESEKLRRPRKADHDDTDQDGWDSDVASVDGDEGSDGDEGDGNSYEDKETVDFEGNGGAASEESGDEAYDNESDGDEDAEKIAHQIQVANRKHKKSGGFQSMGLSYPIYSAIIHKGYKIPTPIQRKAIPVILENRDVVAMARTGSGKTAAFLIPLLERLKTHSARVGARGLILTPSRELALQTLKFIKEIGKHTDLRSCMFVGGGTMDDQFAALANNPDIIIATPGRLMHLIIEMNLDLRTVEYVVFDEADRLFEMGFSQQLREILHKLPETRQTLLFSATLPKLLVDFAKAGLSDPALIRLDADTKISTDLQLMFFSVKAEDKDAALLYLLERVIPADQQTIIFAATKHVVEYLYELLSISGIQSTYVFGALDQVARTMHINRFRNGLAKIMIVTDVAARGIDIPLLDNVVNYDFPGSSKVFIHRVGRVGRAGRKGIAYSLVSSDELPYLLDFQLFTSRPLVYSTHFITSSVDSTATTPLPNYTSDIILGTVPASSLAAYRDAVHTRKKDNVSLQTLAKSVTNAYKMYTRTRTSAAKESYARAKEVSAAAVGVHPVLVKVEENDGGGSGGVVVKREGILEEIRRFRPVETVFEVGRRGLKAGEAMLMQTRRSQLSKTINAARQLRAETESKQMEMQRRALFGAANDEDIDEADLESTFTNISKSSEKSKSKKRKQPESYRDQEFYMSHYQKDAATEKGYAVNASGPESNSNTNTSFIQTVNSATVDMDGDDEELLLKRRQKAGLVWDKKKHEFIRKTVGGDNVKRIRTESGASVPASFKSDRFEQWQKRTQITLPRVGEQELETGTDGNGAPVKKYRHNKIYAANPNSKSFQRKAAAAEAKARKEGKNSADVKKALIDQARAAHGNSKEESKRGKSELRNRQQIAKARRVKEQRRAKTGRHGTKGKSGSGGGGSGGGGFKGKSKGGRK